MSGVVLGMVWEAAFVLGVALVLAQALRVKGSAHTGSRADASANDGSGADVGA